jgi:hypothetical protein
MKSVACSPRVETVEHLQALLFTPVMPRKRFDPLLLYVRHFLPAGIDVQQEYPNGVVRVVVKREGGEEYCVRSTPSSHIALL